MDMDTGPDHGILIGASVVLCLAMALVVKTAINVMQGES
jgi:hypothetical protein